MANRHFPQQSTDSTFYLLAGLGAMTVLFIVAGIVDIKPVMHVFEWLAVVL